MPFAPLCPQPHPQPFICSLPRCPPARHPHHRMQLHVEPAAHPRAHPAAAQDARRSVRKCGPWLIMDCDLWAMYHYSNAFSTVMQD